MENLADSVSGGESPRGERGGAVCRAVGARSVGSAVALRFGDESRSGEPSRTGEPGRETGRDWLVPGRGE